MDATAALAAVRNGNVAALLDALTVDETWTVSALDGRVFGTFNRVGSTTILMKTAGRLDAHGHATDEMAQACALNNLRQMAASGAVITDANGDPVALVPEGVTGIMAMLAGAGVDMTAVTEGPLDGPATGMYV